MPLCRPVLTVLISVPGLLHVDGRAIGKGLRWTVIAKQSPERKPLLPKVERCPAGLGCHAKRHRGELFHHSGAWLFSCSFGSLMEGQGQ